MNPALRILLLLLYLRAVQGQEMHPIAPDTLKIDTLSVDSLVADSATVEDTVNWNSDGFEYKMEEDRIHLYHSAMLKYKGASLWADTILLDNRNQYVEASGRPTIQDGNQPKIEGYRLRYNHQRQIGEIYFGKTVRDGHTFTGMDVRRQKDGEIYIARGCFSPCDDPSFYFYSRRMVLDPSQSVLARPVVMNVDDIPVAVLPMIVVPLGQGRRSGFTRPKFGGDQAQGFYVRDVGYYWALNDYTDFQMRSDIIEGEKGTFDQTNIRGLYNYHLRDKLSGNLGGNAYVSEFNPGNSGWEVNFAHDQRLTPDAKKKLTGNGRFVSSRRILREALSEEEAINQTANARLGYSHNMAWNQARLNAYATQNQNLTTGQLDRELPHVSFAFGAPLFPIEESLFWDAELSETPELAWYRKINYSYQGDLSAFHRSQPDVIQFGGLSPGDTATFLGARNQLDISSKHEVLRYFNVTPGMSGQHFWSQKAGSEGIFDQSIEQSGDNIYKYSASVGVNTKLYGIAQPQLGRWEKLRHVITPSAGFTWAPKIDSNPYFTSHPQMPASPVQIEQKTINLGLDNDVDIKWLPVSDKEGVEAVGYKVLKTSSSASHNFEAKGRKWSPIQSVIRTEIVKNIPLSLQMTHSLYDDFGPTEVRNQVTSPILMSYGFDWRKNISLAGKLNSGILKTGLEADQDPYEYRPWSLNLSYGFQFSATRVAAHTFQENLQHSFNAQVKLNPTPKWEMAYNTDYDFLNGKFSRHHFSFNRTMRCWKMDFTWTPVGISQGWSFRIYVIDLPDIKLESSQTDIRR